MSTQIPRQITGIRVQSCNRRLRHATLHDHSAKNENFTLLFVLEGRMNIATSTRTFVAGKGCCFIGEPGDSINTKSLPPTPPSYYVMGFMPQFDDGGTPSLDEIGLEPVRLIRDGDKVQELLYNIFRLFNGRDRYRLIQCSIHGLQLLLELKPFPGLNRHFPGLPDNRDSDERLEDAIAYIHKNYKRRIPLKTLADKASLHPNNFIRTFKKATGLTPHQYLLNQKIEKAKDFMIFYKESPAVAALELGFHDYAHFSRVFKQHTGLSPKQYRSQWSLPFKQELPCP